MDCKLGTTICVQTYQSLVSTSLNGMEQNRHIERHGAETTELPPLAQGGTDTDRDPFARAIARGQLRLEVSFSTTKTVHVLLLVSTIARDLNLAYTVIGIWFCVLLAGGFGCFVVAAKGLNGNFVIC